VMTHRSAEFGVDAVEDGVLLEPSHIEGLKRPPG
jgi:hypothetical protein